MYISKIVVLTFVATFLAIGPAHADLLVGPLALTPGNGFTLGQPATAWGIQFDANTDSILTAFDYLHHPSGQIPGQVVLKDLTAMTQTLIGSFMAPSPAMISFNGLNILLEQGHTYQLLGSGQLFGATDGYFVYDSTPAPGFSFPMSSSPDGHITVTRGVFENDPDQVWFPFHAWAGFTNIQTNSVPQASPVPEPASLATFGIVALIGAASWIWRRRVGA